MKTATLTLKRNVLVIEAPELSYLLRIKTLRFYKFLALLTIFFLYLYLIKHDSWLSSNTNYLFVQNQEVLGTVGSLKD